MQITTEVLSNNTSTLTNSAYIKSEDYLLFDIETTGFSRKYAVIYMIGFIYKQNSNYIYCNVFAESPEDEAKVISYFLDFIKDYKHIISFNGHSFDIPFIKERANFHNIAFNINHISSIDIYDLIRPYRSTLELMDLKLDTIQAYLDYERDDTHTGASLINVYHDYVKNKVPDDYSLLHLHNKEDVEGMLHLLPLMDLLLYLKQFIKKEDFKYIKSTSDISYLTVIYKSKYPIALNFKIRFNGSVLIFEKNTFNFKLLLPIDTRTKKLFFDNYKDYYHLPQSNEIMHKSVARFLPPNQRTNVNKSDCYIEHKDTFIPLFFNNVGMKVFKDKFNSPNLYVSLDSDMKKDFYVSQLSGFLKNCKK